MPRICSIPFLLLFSLLVASGADAQLALEKPTLIKVTDRVYTATGYALGNVIYVITDSSVVVIDTTESQSTALATL